MLKKILFLSLFVSVSGCGGGQTGAPFDNGNRDTAQDATSDVFKPDIKIMDITADKTTDQTVDSDLSGDRLDSYQDMQDGESPSDSGDLGDLDVWDENRDKVEVMEVRDIQAEEGEEIRDVVKDEGPPPCDDDGLACTGEEINDEGVCVHPILPGHCLINGKCYLKMQPDPDRQCFFCVPARSQTEFSPAEGMPCDDGNACTSTDSCDQTGKCVPGKAVNCNDHNVCTRESCDPKKGCIYKNISGICDDKSVCTTGDHCVNGKCEGSPKPVDDGNPCTEDGCDPKTGVFHKPLDGTKCDDGFKCTVNDHCDKGKCVGDRNTCDDGNPCTTDICNEAAGGCLHDWRYGACDDGDACTSADICNAEHKCVGNEIDCNDYNPCTKDSCDPKKGCVYTPADSTCDDGDPCTESDHCVDGKCVGKPRDCADNNPCTRDYCDPVKGCMHDYSSGACDDGDACTQNDNCGSGKCVGQPVDCDDHNPCTYDWCDHDLGCIHDPVEGLCDDQDSCTTGDHCVDGVCKGEPVDCNDGDPCTDDSCVDGNCQHLPHYGLCDDGNACTEGETCMDGTCTGGTKVDCDDHNVCTIDDCDEKWGCVYTPKPGPCDDNSVCTVHDQCNDGKCVGVPISCDDHNQCTADPCDPYTGCYHTPVDGPCNDNDICTSDDRCMDGHCGGTPAYGDPVQGASTFVAGVSGNPGQGLDVDDNPDTCSPVGNCLQGIDNQLAAIAWLMNPGYTEQVGQGAFTVILDHRAAKFPEGLALYTGKRSDSACDPELAECDMLFFDEAIDNTCQPVSRIEDPKLTGVSLTAGGPNSYVPIRLLFGSLQIPLTLHMVRLRASVTLADDGDAQDLTGVLGGCIRKTDLVKAINATPEEDFQEPYTKEVVSAYAETYLIPDIDSDGNGTKDCVSAGFVFTMNRAHIAGHLADSAH